MAQLSAKDQERIMTAGQWNLVWLKFRKNRVALVSGVVLIASYIAVAFSGYISPYDPDHRFLGRDFVPPQGIHFFDEDGFHFRPFVYGLTQTLDESSGRRVYAQDKTKKYPIRFFVRGDEHDLFGVESTLHVFGVETKTETEQRMAGIFLCGTDRQGRDMFTRLLYGGRVSMTVGLVGVILSVVLGTILGVTAGYFGGIVDHLTQRVIEILRGFPRIPLWMSLSAAIPADFSSKMTYFMITIIMSILSWTGLARVLRGQVLSLRNEEYVDSAILMGASHWRVIFRHLIPAVSGHIIVVSTIAVPHMILAESSLSFLGLGIRPPMVSWGALLQDGKSLVTLFYYSWLLSPALFIIAVVFCFNFLGDGLRDAMDPYSAARR
ncbi:ABC transporter permease [Candidatus Sumerlaeota bacterium]|nr:ABC transporter permease [Candidatus Sumerlaeota bacterium]